MYIQLQLLGYVAFAMLLGGLIGLERELADKPAGLRTHMLVAGAAALFVGVGELLVSNYSSNSNVNIKADPLSVVEAVVAGVSFLGAGTIFRRADQDRVEGLTTAASLLFVAAIGITVVIHQLLLAVSVTLLTLLVLRSVSWLERWLEGRTSKK